MNTGKLKHAQHNWALDNPPNPHPLDAFGVSLLSALISAPVPTQLIFRCGTNVLMKHCAR